MCVRAVERVVDFLEPDEMILIFVEMKKKYPEAWISLLQPSWKAIPSSALETAALTNSWKSLWTSIDAFFFGCLSKCVGGPGANDSDVSVICTFLFFLFW